MDRDEIKAAVREVLDETTVAYSQGAAKFARAVSASLAGLLDAFDEFFTANLVNDPARHSTAKAYVEARMEMLKHASEEIDNKMATFKDHRAQLVALRNATQKVAAKRMRKKAVARRS